MEEITHTIVVDDVSYSVEFLSFHEPMTVFRAAGDVVRFLPWTYRDHMNALSKGLLVTDNGLELSEEVFCRQVLKRCCREAEQDRGLSGLALWWASGGMEPPQDLTVTNGLELGPARVTLKEWSNAERITTVYRSLITHDGNGNESFDVVDYLDTMIRASIESCEPEMDLDELDPRATSILVDAVVNLNAPENCLPNIPFEDNSETARKHAETTLKLCGFLGWTPTKVWSTPAVEVDRLLKLIDLSESSPAKQAVPTSGIANHPDSVVIQFEDD